MKLRRSSRRRARREQGAALLMALFCLALVCLAVVVLSLTVNGQLQVSRNQINRVKAREVTRGALAQTLAKLAILQREAATAALPAGVTSGALGEGSYQVTIAPLADGVFRITATGSVRGIRQQLTACVRRATASDLPSLPPQAPRDPRLRLLSCEN